MGSSVLLLMTVQQLVDFSALAGGDECTSFYSAISNQKLWLFLREVPLTFVVKLVWLC